MNFTPTSAARISSPGQAAPAPSAASRRPQLAARPWPFTAHQFRSTEPNTFQAADENREICHDQEH